MSDVIIITEDIMGNNAKKAKVKNKAPEGLEEKGRSYDKMGFYERVFAILTDVVKDVKWGPTSLALLTVGGVFAGLGIPALLTAVQPYLDLTPNIYLDAMKTQLGGGLFGGAVGVTAWGLRGFVGTAVAVTKSIRKHFPKGTSVKAKTKHLKKSVDKLPAKDMRKFNQENEKVIIRNNVLYAVSNEALVDKVCIKVPLGVTEIAEGAFKTLEMDRPMHLIIPESIETLHLDDIPENTHFVIRDPITRGRLLDDINYDPGRQQYLYDKKPFNIEGATFEKHLFECSVLEEASPQMMTRWLESDKEDLLLLRTLSEDKQRAILQGAYESMVQGGMTIRDFRNLMKWSTIPIQEYKGPVKNHCGKDFLTTARNEFYGNEQTRYERGNPAVEDMQGLLEEIRRIAGPEIKARRLGRPEKVSDAEKDSAIQKLQNMYGGIKIRGR